MGGDDDDARPHGGPPADTPGGPAGDLRARVLTGHRLTVARLGERVRDTFWIVPSLFLAAAIALGLALRGLDRAVGLQPDEGPWWVGTADGATSILETIATAMLTFLGVVFSITLVALQLASQQFSPRVTRTFVRATTTKVALGTFIATFVCALLALSSLEAGAPSDAASPVVSVSVSLVLVGASLVVFIAFVNNTTRLIRISHIIGAVADETRRAIDDNYPREDGYETLAAPPPRLGEPTHVVRGAGGRRLRGADRGVVLAVDTHRLIELARTHDCLLRVVPAIGEYVPGGAPLVEVHGGRAPSDWQVLRCISLGRERTLYQDPAYGIRQLADIAAQSLSAAVNAPTTAVQVIDRLTDLLPRIAERPDPSGLCADRDRRLRVIVPVTLWPELVELAFTEIRVFGARSPQVVRRALAALDDVRARVPEPRRAPVEAQRRSLRDAAHAAGVQAGTARPDRLGLG